MAKLVRAAGYLRVSTEEQVDGFSLRAQRQEIQQEAESLGYEIVDWYEDAGVSAHTDKLTDRAALTRLLLDAEKHHFGIVIAHELSRLARNLRVQGEVLARLGRAGVGFRTVRGNLDWSTPEGWMQMQLMGVFNEFQSDLLGEHVKKAHRIRVKSGLPVGPVPFGYEIRDTGGVAQLVDEQAALVREAFRRRAAGASNGSIARWLNAQGFKTRNGRNATPYSVRDMFDCRFYVGVITHHGREHPGQHDAIVSDDLFRAAQALRQPRRAPRSCQRENGVLQGLIACVRCRSRVHSERNGRGEPRYRERHGRTCSSNGKSVVAHRIDDQFAVIFKYLILDPAWRDKIAKLATKSTTGPSLDSLLRRRKKIQRVYMDDGITTADYKSWMTENDQAIAACCPTTPPQIEEAAALLKNLDQLWTEATPRGKQRLAASLIRTASVDLEGKVLMRIEPQPGLEALLEGAAARSSPSAPVVIVPADAERVDVGMVETGENRTPRPVGAHPAPLRA